MVCPYLLFYVVSMCTFSTTSRCWEQSSFSKLSVASPSSQNILQPFPQYLRHSSFSNPSVASPTSQFILQPFFRFSYVTGSSLNVTWRAAHLLSLCIGYVDPCIHIPCGPSWPVMGYTFRWYHYMIECPGEHSTHSRPTWTRHEKVVWFTFKLLKRGQW